MSSLEVFTWLHEFIYWVFELTLESVHDRPWQAVLLLGFVAFGYWMYRQVQYNKEAENNPDQLK
jgi:hypothetical protein